MKTIDFRDFKDKFYNQLSKRGELQFEEIQTDVQNILDDIKENGNTALIKYELKFDKIQFSEDQIQVTTEEIQQA